MVIVGTQALNNEWYKKSQEQVKASSPCLMKIYIQRNLWTMTMPQPKRAGDIFDFIGMTKEVTPTRSQGINQDVTSLDYMNKVPKNKNAADR